MNAPAQTMITCPWCGTAYPTFQSNCKNCGGPLLPPRETASPSDAETLPVPPPPPRPISNNYAMRLLFMDGWGIAGFVFGLLGTIFTLLGFGLTLGIITAFVGIPFLGVGLVFLAAGIPLLAWRYQEKQKIVGVLRHGQAMQGQITGIQQNLNVRINHRHPWVISYRFQVMGREYPGETTTLSQPGEHLQPGKPAWVLYLPNTPELNTIYPHP